MTDRLIALALLALVSVYYLAGLAYSPVYLLNDEIYNALQARSLADTGRSVGGDFLPVFFRGLEFPPGRDPLCVYATALALTLLPISEVALRVPTALIGLVNIVLVYAIGRRIWGDTRFGLLAAAMLATMPAHYLHSRIGIPALWSLPWLLAWLLALLTYGERRQTSALAASGACLAMAVYGYLGTALLVPLFLAATVVFLFAGLGERTARPYAVVACAFAVPLVFVGYWHVLHPERWSELATYYLTNTSALRPGAPVFTPSGLPNFAAIQERVSAYWNYFNPTFLFLSGDASPRYSTGRAGLFLLPAIGLLPLGIYRAVQARPTGWLLLFGLACSPLAGAFGGDVQVQRALPFLVFGSLLSTWGAVALITHPSRRARRAVPWLAALAVLQIVLFTADYFGSYRLRSGATRGGNLSGAFAAVTALAERTPLPALYLDDRVDNIALYWRFYASERGVAALVDRVRLVPSSDWPSDAPPGALFVTGAKEGLPRSAAWELRTRIEELDGTSFYSIFQKQQ